MTIIGIPLLGSLYRWYQTKRKIDPNPTPSHPLPHRRLSSIEMLFNRIVYKLSRQLSSHANIAIVHPHSDDIDEGRSVGFAEEDESIAPTIGGGRTVNHFFIVGTSSMEHKYVGSRSGEMMFQTARNSDEGGEEDRGLDKENQESLHSINEPLQ